jgi:hypothetical protein
VESRGRGTEPWDRSQIERVLKGRRRRPAPNGQTWTSVDRIEISSPNGTERICTEDHGDHEEITLDGLPVDVPDREVTCFSGPFRAESYNIISQSFAPRMRDGTLG